MNLTFMISMHYRINSSQSICCKLSSKFCSDSKLIYFLCFYPIFIYTLNVIQGEHCKYFHLNTSYSCTYISNNIRIRICYVFYIKYTLDKPPYLI